MKIEPGALIGVTGGTGALGRQFVNDALDAGYRVRLLTRNPEVSAGRGVETRYFDLGHDEIPEPEMLHGCSAAVHLGAHIPADQADPAAAQTCLETNALGTLRLLLAMERAGVTRLLQTTSANGYSSGIDRPHEGSAMYPDGRAPYYLASKIVQDIFGGFWGNRRGAAVTTLRLSSLYGAGQPGGVVAHFGRSLLAGKEIGLANGGRFGADFATLADASRALLLFLAYGAAGPYNIASGVRSTLIEIAEKLAMLAGADRRLISIGEAVQGADDGFPAIDISRAISVGFDPTPLDRGLAELMDWLKSEGG
jgi:UDP-glucose 4-epimerase